MSRNIPLYQKIYNHFRDQILSGALQEGACLPTEADLMEQFGVSRTTVKGALNALKADGYLLRRRGSGSYVAPRPQQKVLAVSRRQIGLVLPTEQRSSHFFQLIEEATDVLTQQSYQLVLYPYRHHPTTEREAILKARADGCVGLIYYPVSSLTMDILCHLVSEHFPVVILDKKIDHIPLSCIISDNVGGTEKLMQHLIEKSYRRFAFLTFNETSSDSSTTQRYLGCCRAIHAAGLPDDALVFRFIYSLQETVCAEDDSSSVTLQRLKPLLLELHEQKIQVVCALSDSLAILVCQALHQLGIAIPRQMAVAGFDDSDYARFSTPALTTVRQNFREQGRLAAQTLLSQIASPPKNPVLRTIPTQIIERETT